MTASTLIVLHHGYRPVSSDAVVEALGGLPALGHLPTIVEVDTAQFQSRIDAGDWTASHEYLVRRARDVQEAARVTTAARVVYAGGMPEVAHAVAFGAYFEDFYQLEPFDLRDTGSAAWFNEEATLALTTTGVPTERVLTSGPVVLRIQLSASIDDAQVERFVGLTERVADVVVQPRDAVPRPGLVRTVDDFVHARSVVADAIAGLRTFRPNATVMHLFIAAPPSICVTIGQAFRLRDGVRVQTYRHRAGSSGAPELSEALLLSASGVGSLSSPLTDYQRADAVRQRADVWSPAIAQVQRYADRKERIAARLADVGRTLRWYEGVVLGAELAPWHPFLSLPPVHRVVERPAYLDPESFGGEFGFERGLTKRWRLNDQLVVRLSERFPLPADAGALARMFLFHEYLHVVHGITKPTAAEVGKFANGLEHADYMCDLYAILHELDFEAEEEPVEFRTFPSIQRRLVALIDLVIRSFWAFEPSPERQRMEYRRLRRYLNWYWQRTRVGRAQSLRQIAAILARKPIVELAGLESRAEGRRHFASLTRMDQSAHYEMCVVLDDERLHRIVSQPSASLMEMLAAFRTGDHGALVQVFEQVFEFIGETALPPEALLP